MKQPANEGVVLLQAVKRDDNEQKLQEQYQKVNSRKSTPIK